MTARAGVTLLELLIVLAILSILAGVVGLALHAAPPANASDESTARVIAARDSAIRFGHAVTVQVIDEGCGAARYCVSGWARGGGLPPLALILSPAGRSMLRADRRDRSGVVLLEALVALLILTTAGAAAITMVAEGARDIGRVRLAEKRMHDASAFFDAVSLWSRDDLDRHLGNRSQGDWLMRVDRPDPELYVVSLTDTATEAELLRTSLYRSEVAHAEP